MKRKMKRAMKQRVWMALVLAAVLSVIPVSSSQAKVKVLERLDDGAVVQIGGEEGIDPQYVNTSTITADISISGSTAHVHASVIAKKVCHVSVVMRLQYKDGNSWVTKRSWVAASDSGYKIMSENAPLSQRGLYRTYAIFDVAGEKLTYTSSAQRY